MAQAAENLPQNLFIDDTPGLNILSFSAPKRGVKMQHGIGFGSLITCNQWLASVNAAATGSRKLLQHFARP